MTILIAWFVLAYGFSNIMVYGSIFSGIREGIKKWGNNPYAIFNGVGKFISDLLSCMMCTSTWVGFFLGLFIFSPTYFYFGLNPVISWFFDGLLASGAVWAINSVIEWFEENRPNK
jgi:hypothetical protein